MRYLLALSLVCLSGYVALSYEIVWFRIVSYASGGRADAFGLVLASYLAGIAAGSLFSRAYCGEQEGGRHSRALLAFVIAANCFGYLVVPLCAWVSALHASTTPHLLIVLVAAGLLGVAFPLISHLGIDPTDRVGARLSYLYLANIIGSSAGSLVTGFVLMEHMGTPAIGGVTLALGCLLGILLALYVYGPSTKAAAYVVGLTVLAGAAGVYGEGLHDDMWARLSYKTDYRSGETTFSHIVETRSGVITVTEDGIVRGGGMYDGQYSVDLKNDVNRIVRAYALGAVHPAPKNVLMIGLGSGSWAQAVASHPAVEKLVVVEINHGYQALLNEFPVVASLAHNPKVDLVVDDGRRWLTRNPDARFDAVVQNTTWHWRMMISNLLSMEYMALIRRHLLPGGVFLYNTTGSDRAYRTGLASFKHGIRFFNTLIAADHPLQLDYERWERVLANSFIDGKPLYDLRLPEERTALESLFERSQAATEPGNQLLARIATVPVITDDNMGEEW